jgi:superfamily II DNA or RNA helicase
MELRPYQTKAIDELRAAYKEGCTSPVLQLPTGGGKTIIFCNVAKLAIAKGNNVLILVHRRELITQTCKDLEMLGIDYGVIAPKFKETKCNLQVASVQTLVRRLKTIKFKPTLIIIDEAHHSVAATWVKILLHFHEAKLLGVTATPERLDGRGLEEYFDKLILGPSVKYLIENSFLSNVKVFTVPVCLSRELIKIKDGDFSASDSVQQLEDAGINGNAVTEYTKRCPNKPAIVFCCNIKHAVGMAALFAQAGYKAASLVSKGVSPEQRTQLIEDLGNGNLDILTSVDIVSEGTNIPIVETAILLRPTKSLAIYLQQVGRILRKYPGKEFALVIDCVGNVSTHGMPQKDREWSLEATARDKEKAPSAFTCENCFAVFERPSTQSPVVCPECGHEHWPEDKGNGRPKEDLTVDLVEVVENENFITPLEKTKLIAKASSRKDFIEVGKKLGYKPGGAFYKWNEFQGKSKPPAPPVKQKKFNISEIMRQAGIPEPDWTKRED